MNTQVAANDNSLQEAFDEYDQANPNVYDLIKHFTMTAIQSGRKHYSMMSIMQRVRWHTNIETNGDAFKINNNFAPYYARKFMAEQPNHNGFFKTRKVKGDAHG